jgi:hypothetical protein
MAEADPLATAVLRSDWWTMLACATAWQALAEAISGTDPGAARLAWQHAAQAYAVYNAEHAAHLPASRFDHDYGPELSAAEAAARSLAPAAPSDALPGWLRAVLDRRFTDALNALPGPPSDAGERAAVRMLAIACRATERVADAERLEGWASAPTDAAT